MRSTLSEADCPSDAVATLYPCRYFPALDSTNSEARRLAQQGSPGNLAIVAGEQTQGRGRGDRPWASPPGNLYLSLLLRPTQSVRLLPQLGFAAAVAVAQTIAALQPTAPVTLKWPNDVLVAGRKISGILLEARLSPGSERAEWLIAGIGVNIASAPLDTATCLADLDRFATPEDLAADVLAAFGHWHSLWQEQGFSPVRRAWLARGHRVGDRLSVRRPGGECEGTFRDLDLDGTLLLDTASGPLRIVAGDIHPLS